MLKLNLIEISLLGALFIFSIVLFRAWFRKYLPQRVFMFLWYLAIVRLLFPFSFVWEVTYRPAPEAIDYAASEFANQIWQGALQLTDTSIMTENAQPQSILPISLIIRLLWMFGMFPIALYFFWSYRCCRRNFRESLPVQDKRILCMIEDIILEKPSREFRHIRVRSFDKINSPLTYGIFHPIILLPKKLLTELEEKTSADAIKIMLTHEFIHIKRMDALTKMLLAAVLAIHWFNPFVWLMYILANRDIEIVCDESVIQRLGEHSRSLYASLLLHMEVERAPSLSVHNHFSKNILEERITEIMKGKKITILSSLCAVLFVFGAVFAIFVKKAEAGNVLNETTAISKETVSPETSSSISEETTEATSENTEIIDNLGTSETQTWIWVTDASYPITSTFGERVHPITGQTASHDHITIGGVDGADILAAMHGTVVETGFETHYGWGNYVVLEHEDGFRTMYTHCKEIFVKVDDAVNQGYVIATMGKTGKATGVCLGFYIYKDGVPQNPENYLPLIDN